MLKTYLLQTGRRIDPFGPLAALQIHNQPFPSLQERVLRSLGCEVERITSLAAVRSTPCLVVHDDVYFTRAAIAGLIRVARQETGNLQAALPVSILTESIAPELQGRLDEHDDGQRRTYDAYFLRDLDPHLLLQHQSRPVLIPARIGKISAISHPRFAENGRHLVPLSDVFLSPVHHWANAVACNVLGMLSFVLLEARRRWLATALLPLAALLRSGSMRPSRLVGAAYWRGRRCRIHPSAHVEGSVLGSRVRVHPHAVVRHCIIDDQAVIGANACLEGCTVGNRAIIAAGSYLRGSTFGAESSIATSFNQLSMIGRGAVLCPESVVLDFSLRGTVPVRCDGERVRSGSLILGGAIGDDAFLGPGVRIGCGGEIPNGCVLIRNPRELVRGGEADELPSNIRRLDRRRAG